MSTTQHRRTHNSSNIIHVWRAHSFHGQRCFAYSSLFKLATENVTLLKLTILYTRWYKALLSMCACRVHADKHILWVWCPQHVPLEPCWYRLSTALTSHIYGRQLCGRRTSSAIVQILSPVIHFSHLAAIVQTFVNKIIVIFQKPKQGEPSLPFHRHAASLDTRVA